jgi:hypothetical protein
MTVISFGNIQISEYQNGLIRISSFFLGIFCILLSVALAAADGKIITGNIAA